MATQQQQQQPAEQAPSACPAHVLKAIYGDAESKQEAYNASLNRWWREYSDRKNHEDDEHVADSLLYDRKHLPRAAPPPDSVFQERERLKQQQQQQAQPQG